MKKVFIFAIAFLSLNVVAQQEHNKQTTGHVIGHENENHGRHKISLYSGFTHISSAFYEHETHEESTGKWVPTIGLDYYYTLNHKWEVGIIGDIELDQYYIKTNLYDELERNNVVVFSAIGKYKPINRLGILAGPGIEWEFKRHDTESFFVLKTGIEYEVAIENGWELTPVFTYDFKEEYSAYAFGITIGKRF